VIIVVCISVCLFVCLFVHRISLKLITDLNQITLKGPRKFLFNSGANSDESDPIVDLETWVRTPDSYW